MNLVRSLKSSKWETLTRQQVRGIWPEVLQEKGIESLDEKDPKKNSVMLNRKGLQRDVCECCETFEFDLEKQSDGTIRERLRWVALFHSQTEVEPLISFAQNLLMEIVPSEKEKIYAKDKWNLDNPEKTIYQIYRTEKSGADVSISPQNDHWTLYFGFYIDPSKMH